MKILKKFNAIVRGGLLRIKKTPEWENAIKALEGQEVWFVMDKIWGKRTLPQNSALHLFLTQLAEALNEQGITLQQLLARSVEVYPTMENLKEDLWRPLQIKMFAKKSTTELAKLGEINQIYDSINKAVAFWGIHIPWPSKTSDENFLITN